MKIKCEAWNITDEIYNAHLSLFIGDIDAFYDHITQIGVEDDRNDHRHSRGFMMTHESKYFIIWMRNWDPTVFAHELIHHTINVMADRGVRISDVEQEPMAYYVEMMTRLVYGAIKKKPDHVVWHKQSSGNRTPARKQKS